MNGGPNAGGVALALANSTGEPLELTLEPWGDVLFLAPGVSYVLKLVSPTPSSEPDVTIEPGGGCLSIWSHQAGATLRLTRPDGTLVWQDEGPIAAREAMLATTLSGEILKALAEHPMQKTDPLIPEDVLLTLVESGLVREDVSGLLRLTEIGTKLARRGKKSAGTDRDLSAPVRPVRRDR